MPDPHGALEAGQPMYTNGFLPAVYQPTMLRRGPRPVLNLDLPAGVTPEERRKTVDLIRDLNEANAARRRRVRRPHPRLRPGVQDADRGAGGLRPLARDAGDARPVRHRHEADRRLRPALPAGPAAGREGRALRGASSPAAGRATCSGTRTTTSRRTTSAWPARPTSRSPALLTDLKRRGLLDSTLVLWGGEFGRSPEAQDGKGRDHHNLGFTMWLAGGGIKGGQVVGATDAIGLRAVEKPYHFRDIHTTILHQLGLDQDQLTYPHLGRNERLTFVEGKVIKEIV